MTKIKICGLTRECDIEAANLLRPEYIGFVFYKKSKRYIEPEKAAVLRSHLKPEILPVGVFVDETPEKVVELLNKDVIGAAQLHGSEDGEYINILRSLSDKPIIKAFRVKSEEDIARAESSSADHILLDSGAGSGEVFDWSILKSVKRPYFLAGGLNPGNAAEAVRALHPYALDVSSGVETDGLKDKNKMTAFADAVRKETGI